MIHSGSPLPWRVMVMEVSGAGLGCGNGGGRLFLEVKGPFLPPTALVRFAMVATLRRSSDP